MRHARRILRSATVGLSLATACDAAPPRGAPSPAEPAAVADAVHPRPLEDPARIQTRSAPPAAVSPPAWRNADGTLLVPDHWLPGPARRHEPARDPTARLAADEACRRCHAAAAREHATSQHAGSWTGRALQRAFTVEPRAFCQRCHAPEEDAATPVGEVTPVAASLGVGCVTCHVEPGTTEVFAAPRTAAAEPDARAPHPIVRSPAFAGPQACAGCHEFPFPDHALRDHPLAMQSTVTEHARSPAADQSCADCHMPRDPDARRRHAFPGAHDPAMLARALELEATRPDPTTVHVRLAPGQVGHAVPTGDLLRRLAVEVQIDGPDGAPAFTATRYYGRRFGPERQHSGLLVRGELADERVGVGADERVATFTLPPALAHAPVRWQVLHQRVAHASRDPRQAPLDGELPVAAGVLLP